MTPKSSQNQMSALKETKKKESCSTTWVGSKSVSESNPYPQKKHTGAAKVKNNPKIKPMFKVKIKGIIDNESLYYKGWCLLVHSL